MPIDPLILRVLAVNCRVTGTADGVVVTDVDTVRSALSAVRNGQFDLLLTTGEVDGGAVWPLVGKVRRVRPKLRWWLVARGIDADTEVLARTLGVTRLLYAVPTAGQLRPASPRPRPACPPLDAAEAIPADAIAADAVSF